MYINYFELKEKPFSISPDPRYLYMSELHREALAHLLYGISGDGCLILLTGDVGTGKTTVCRCLLAQLPEHTEVALLVNPRLTSQEMLESICDELGVVSKGNDKSSKAFLDALNSYLLEAHALGKNVALLIDEAQNLSLELLEQLRMLTNLETDHKKLLKIVLLGQSELRQILERPEASQISQRITSRFHLQPLDRDDSNAYIRHRLAVAGTREKVFSREALNKIYHLTRGIPRLINVLCDRAMLGAYVEQSYTVTGAIVDRAANEVFENRDTALGEKIHKGVRFSLKWWLVFFVIAAVLIFIFGSRQAGEKSAVSSDNMASHADSTALQIDNQEARD